MGSANGARRSFASTWTPRTADDFGATLATFGHPRYELVPTGDVYDGEPPGAPLLRRDTGGLPGPAQHAARAASPPTRDGVIIEIDLREGTHLGSYRGLPATGRAFSCPMMALFLFEPGTAKIVLRAGYFDPP